MPTILDRIRAALQAAIDPMDRKAAPYRFNRAGGTALKWNLVDYETYASEGFADNTLIYSAIMYKARAAMQVPLVAYGGDIESPERLPATAPLQLLCSRPNPSQSWAQHVALQTVYLNIAGNAFTAIDRQGKTPMGLYPLRPDRVSIIYDTDGVVGYDYKPDGAMSTEDTVTILPEDMIHLKYPNPLDRYDGMGLGLSPLTSAARPADVDNAVTTFLKRFFDSGVQVAGILSFNDALTPEIADTIKSRWRDAFGGARTWGDVGVLDNGAKYQRVGFTFDEMAFTDIDERNEARIMQALGVPPILTGSKIGLMRSTFSNYEQARIAFWEDVFIPELTSLQNGYNWHLKSDQGFLQLDYSRVPAVQDKRLQRVESFAILFDRGYPRDMAADIAGLDTPPTADGDIGYLPTGMQRVSSTDDTTTPDAPAGDGEGATDDTRSDLNWAGQGAALIPPEHLANKWQHVLADYDQSVKSQPSGQSIDMYRLADDVAGSLPVIADVWQGSSVQCSLYKFAEHSTPAKYRHYVQHLIINWQTGVKSYGSYNSSLMGLTQQFMAAEISQLAFMVAFRLQVQGGLTEAFYNGAADCGILPDEIVPAEQVLLAGMITDSTSRIPNLGNWLQSQRQQGATASDVAWRIKMWGNRWIQTRSTAQITVCDNIKLQWIQGPTEKGCPDCSKVHTRIYRSDIWLKYGWQPQSIDLDCKGFNCLCRLQPTLDPATTGRPPTL